MQLVYFKINRIPDTSLVKYQDGNTNGVDGLLKMHEILLRQLHGKGLVSGISIHLFYFYHPNKDIGERLSAFLGIKGEMNALINVEKIIRSSSLSQYYELSDMQMFDLNNHDEMTQRVYSKMCFLTKKEIFTEIETEEYEKRKYYTVADWSPNESGRLYQLYSIMEALNRESLFRVDLYPVDMSQSIRDIMNNPISEINVRKEKQRKASLTFDKSGLDFFLDSYNDIIEKVEKNPHFLVNIVAFGETNTMEQSDDLEVILQSAVSEALSEGNYAISSFSKASDSKLSAIHLLGIDEENDLNSAISLDGKTLLQKISSTNCTILFAKEAERYNIRFLPVLFTFREIVPFFRLPVLYENEEIQIKKETAPVLTKQKDSDIDYEIGRDQNNRPILFNQDSFVKHMFISGVPGSGKTNCLLSVTSMLADKDIHFLVFEPAKKEYRALLNTETGKKVILMSPHLDSPFPVQINPFEFPKGIMLSQHIGFLMRVFSGAFEVEKVVYEILDSSIEKAYMNCHWKLNDINDGNKEYPTLQMVYDLIEKEVDKYEYDGEIKGNIKSFIHVRLGGLLKRDAGEIFNVTKSSWQPEEWITRSVIMELEALADQDKSFLVLVICNLIYETLIMAGSSKKLKHVLFIEEAHNIIAPTSYQTGESIDPKISATSFIVKMLAEVRALGEGIVIADQLPSAMAPEVMKNTVSKIVFKMMSGDDREIVGSTMMASGTQLEKMPTYDKGWCLYFGEGMQKPLEMQFVKWQENDILYESPSDHSLAEQIDKNDERYGEIFRIKNYNEKKELNDLDEELRNDLS